MQLTLAFSQEGEAYTGEGGGTQSATARTETRTLAQSLMEAVVEPWNMRLALKRVKVNRRMRTRMSGGVRGEVGDELTYSIVRHKLLTDLPHSDLPGFAIQVRSLRFESAKRPTAVSVRKMSNPPHSELRIVLQNAAAE